MKQSSNYSSRQKSSRYRSPYKWYFWLALVLTLVVIAVLVLLKFPLYLAFMTGLNAVTFSFYGYDKIQAKRDGGRVPELVLHWLAVLGGAPGGIAGQWLFRHKIRKPIFHIVLWSSFILHLIVFVFFNRVLLSYNYTDLLTSFKLLSPFFQLENIKEKGTNT